MSYLGTVVTTTPALYWLPQLYEIQKEIQHETQIQIQEKKEGG